MTLAVLKVIHSEAYHQRGVAGKSDEADKDVGQFLYSGVLSGA